MVRSLLVVPFAALVLAACSIESESPPSSIYVVDVERGVIVDRFSGGEESYWGPSLSPDGSTVAFSAFIEGSDVAEIYLMNSDGSEVRPLLDTQFRDMAFASWHPDGQWIVFHGTEKD